MRSGYALVTHWAVADSSLDLAIYLHGQGLSMPQNVNLPTLIEG